MSENKYQLSVAGKIKKHFNTGPKLNSTTAGVSVITVSAELQLSTYCLRVGISRLHHAPDECASAVMLWIPFKSETICSFLTTTQHCFA